MKNKISVIGGGSWGTAITYLLSNNGFDTNMYLRDEAVLNDLIETKENKKYLPGVIVNKAKFTNKIEAVKDSDYIVLATPSSAIISVLDNLKKYINENAVIVNLAKGFEPKSQRRISEVAKEILPKNDFVVLSGPSHAEEVGKDIPTAVVCASASLEASKKVQDIFSNDKFRVYTNNDLIGVEIGGALKNIIALGAGMSDGLGYGDNTKAALMTRGIYEMSKLGIVLGANPHTFTGLSGIGDLIVTCTSMHSRNRRAGILIGKGKSKEEASKEVGQVVEGIETTKSAYELSLIHKVDMPIVRKLYKVLYEEMNPEKAVKTLMTRDKKAEIEQIFFE